jgi:tetratricopeptide (TPR) repeat protein
VLDAPAGRRTASALLLGATLGLAACAGRHAGEAPEAEAPTPAAEAKAGLPAWLPPYSSAQLALLAPTDAAIDAPSPRVFPDLERFGYARTRRIEAADAAKFTRMVATVLRDSPRFYALAEASSELANVTAQYGPPATAEADAWSIARLDADGIGTLVRADLHPEARQAFERGAARYEAGDLPLAIAAFQAALDRSPRVPGVALSLAEALAASGDTAGARRAYEEAIRIDPSFASAHRGLADLLWKAGEGALARREIAEALAYHPGSKRALEIADRIAPGSAGDGDARILPYRIFLDVDSTGAIRVAAGPTAAAQMYGGCRAVLRYEPDVRAAIFEQPRETPYYLSMVEEIVCLEAAIGAHLFERAGGGDDGSAVPDPTVEALLELGETEGLGGYVMFEILGQQRPERARTAPPEVHEATVRYVERHVLGGPSARLSGSYSAQL